jgi:hypothetical protein
MPLNPRLRTTANVMGDPVWEAADSKERLRPQAADLRRNSAGVGGTFEAAA